MFKTAQQIWSMFDPSVSNRLEAFAPLAREPSVEVAFTKSGNLWLVNRGVAAVNLTHGELFGFNVGAYVEVPAGQVTKKVDIALKLWGHY